MDDVMALLHIVAAVFIVGPMAILPMTALKALRQGDGPEAQSLTKSTQIFSLLSLITVVFGFGVQGIAGVPFSSTWIWLSVVLYVIALALALGVVVPAMQGAVDELTAAGTDAATPSGYGKVASSSGVMSLLLVVIVALMVLKV